MVVKEKKVVLKEAKGEAKRIVDAANRQVEKTIRDIKEHQADKRKTKQAREELEQFRRMTDKPEKQPKKKESGLVVGDFVRLDNQESVGEIVGIMKKEAQVQFGALKSFVKLDRLERVRGYKKESPKMSSRGVNILQRSTDFTHELDIRGERAEVALPTIDSFVDDAIVLGVREVRVIHGKGHGILRELLRNHLSDHPTIASIADEHADRGGSGISILTFK